jgi:hypothetical protein
MSGKNEQSINELWEYFNWSKSLNGLTAHLFSINQLYICIPKKGEVRKTFENIMAKKLPFD